MDCFENNTLLESVQCGVYDVAQGFYDYAYSFAQGVDDAIDSLIPRLPGVDAQVEFFVHVVNEAIEGGFGVDLLDELADTDFGRGFQQLQDDFDHDIRGLGRGIVRGVGGLGDAAGEFGAAAYDWMEYREDQGV